MTQDEFNARLDEGEVKGWVYLIEAGKGGPVKVGWAKDPQRRMSNLQAGHPEQLSLLAVIPGTRHLEGEIHRKLGRHANRGGEWFDRRAALRLLNPIIQDHGVRLLARAVESRNSPEMLPRGRREKREFLVEITEA